MSIQIGAMMPDRNLDESLFIKAVTQVAIELAGNRDQTAQKRLPVLDIVFLLPSEHDKADFVGLRINSFDVNGQVLKFESAVPEKMINSNLAERFILALILDAIDAAIEFFTEQRILFDSASHVGLIELISAKEPSKTYH